MHKEISDMMQAGYDETLVAAAVIAKSNYAIAQSNRELATTKWRCAKLFAWIAIITGGVFAVKWIL